MISVELSVDGRNHAAPRRRCYRQLAVGRSLGGCGRGLAGRRRESSSEGERPSRETNDAVQGPEALVCRPEDAFWISVDVAIRCVDDLIRDTCDGIVLRDWKIGDVGCVFLDQACDTVSSRVDVAWWRIRCADCVDGTQRSDAKLEDPFAHHAEVSWPSGDIVAQRLGGVAYKCGSAFCGNCLGWDTVAEPSEPFFVTDCLHRACRDGLGEYCETPFCAIGHEVDEPLWQRSGEGNDVRLVGGVGEYVGGGDGEMDDALEDGVGVESEVTCAFVPRVAVWVDAVIASNLHGEAQLALVRSVRKR